MPHARFLSVSDLQAGVSREEILQIVLYIYCINSPFPFPFHKSSFLANELWYMDCCWCGASYQVAGWVPVCSKTGFLNLRSSKEQSYPGMHQKKSDHQGKGSDSPFCSALMRCQLEYCGQFGYPSIRGAWRWSTEGPRR